MKSAEAVARVRLGISRRRGDSGGGPERRAVPTWTVSGADGRSGRRVLVGRGLQQRPERPGLAGQPGPGTLLHDAPAVEHRDLLGALGRREPVGDQQAGAPGEQPLGGAHHVGLGDRVHPGRGLVEDHHPDVAHQQAGERDELLLAGRQRGAARAEQGVEPVGEPGDPGVEAELGDGALDVGRAGPARTA